MRVVIVILLLLGVSNINCNNYVPPNDECISAKFINFYSEPTTIVEGTNIHSISDNLDSLCGSSFPSSGDVWYYFYSEDYETISISTCFNGGKTNFDTTIYLLSFQEDCNNLSGSNCIAFNDDFPGCLYGSQISYQRIEKNSKYFIVVGGNSNSMNFGFGTFELSVRFETSPNNGDCETAIDLVLTEAGQLVEGILENGAPSIVPGCQSGNFDGTSVWYTLQSGDFNFLIVSSCYSGGYSQYPVELSLFTLDSCAAQNTVCIAYDSSSCPVEGSIDSSGNLEVFVRMQTQYYLAVSSEASNEVSNFGLFIAGKKESPPNDECTNPTLIVSTNIRITGYLQLATPDGVAVGSLCSNTEIHGRNVWYAFNSLSNNRVTIDFCTAPSSTFGAEPVIYLSSAPSCDCLMAIVNNCAAHPSGITMAVTTNTQYLLSIGGDSAGLGNAFFTFLFVLSVDNSIPNVQCAQATDISTIQVAAIIQSQFPATLPYPVGYSQSSCSTVVDSPLLWFQFTSRMSDSYIEISSCAAYTSFNTKLYLFSDCSAQSCIASNDDISTCGTRSFVSASVSPGQNYKIALGSSNGQSGNFELTLFQYASISSARPSNDACANSISISVPSLGSVFETTSNFIRATVDNIVGYSMCGDLPQNFKNVWYQFQTTDQIEMTISLCPTYGGSLTGFSVPRLTLYYSPNTAATSICEDAVCVASDSDSCSGSFPSIEHIQRSE